MAEPKIRKVRSKPWTPDTEKILIHEVLDREEVLFGAISGTGSVSIHRKRADGWKEITDIINSESASIKRDTDEVKKKYFNLKQRAKQKIDELKKLRLKTGGGNAPPTFTAAEEALSAAFQGRPAVHGLDTGLDTDEIEDASVTAVTELAEGTEATENDETCLQRLSADCSKGKDGTDMEGKYPTLKKRKRQSEQEAATLENTILDSERIKLEQEKLRLEIISLQKQNLLLDSKAQVMSLKKAYYEMKLLTEFGIQSEQ